MQIIPSGALTAGLLTIAAIVMGGQSASDNSWPGRMAEAGPAVRAEGTIYRLRIGGGEPSCILEKGAVDMDGGFEALAGPKCPALYPPLAEVRLWRDKSEATVELARANGTAVLELTVSDGFAYETFQPGSPLISLVALTD